MQAQETVKTYVIYYKDPQGRRYVTSTKPCTKAAAIDAWKELNSFGQFTKTKMVAYG